LKIIDFLHELSIKYPKKTALVFDGGSLTYAGLYKKVTAFASGLIDKGLKKGDKAAILMYNTDEFVIAFLAVISCGGVAVPVNPLFLPEELEYVLRHSEAKVFISSKDFDEHIAYVSRGISDISLIIASGYNDIFYKGTVLFDEIYKENTFFSSFTLEKEPCAIIYSSSDSGYIKGTVLNAECFLSNAQSCAEALGINESDKMITYLPLYHPFSLIAGLFMVFKKGATAILVKNDLPFKKIVRTALLKRATVFAGIPYLFNLLSIIKTPKLLKLVNPIRMCISFGDSLPGKVGLAFCEKYNIPLVEGYGLIEAGALVSVNKPDCKEVKVGSAGFALEGVNIFILNSSGKEAAVGETGEIAVKGTCLASGYYKDEYSTKKAFKDGFFLTGDMGIKDEEGKLHVYGRKSDIIRSGKDVCFTGEICTALYNHPGIEDVCVVPFGSRKGDVLPFVFAVLKHGEKTTGDDILKYLNSRDEIKIKVEHIEILDALPRNSCGKADRKELIKIAIQKAGLLR
jgi:long-chain acyl-CoA synthetase